MSIIKYKTNDDVNIEKLRELSYTDMFKCVNACWYYLDNLASNVWSENEAKIILAECFIENGDIDAALAVLDEVLINDRYNFDALKLIVINCLDALDKYERKTIGGMAILAYEKIAIECARKGENPPVETAILLSVEDAGGNIYDDDIIKVVDRKKDVVNVMRETAHIARMYGNARALQTLESDYNGISHVPSFIALKAYYHYLCGNYDKAAELCEASDADRGGMFYAVLKLRSTCYNYFKSLKNKSETAAEWHKIKERDTERLLNSIECGAEIFHEAVETLFYAEDYESAAELIENSEYSANSKSLMYLAAAKFNLGDEDSAFIIFRLAHSLYRKYCDAGLNYTDNELFVPNGGKFAAEDIKIINRDISAEIDEIIDAAAQKETIDELDGALAIAVSHAYAASDADKLSKLICDIFDTELIKENADFFRKLTYNPKTPNRIKADILYRLMLAYPKKYVACGFGKVVHFTKYLADAKLINDEFRFKTYLYALSRKYVFHDTTYSYEYDVIYKRFDILFPSKLKLNKKDYKLAALFASKLCFYYKPIYTDEMLCSEFGIDVEYFRKAYDNFIAKNKLQIDESEALCTKEFGYSGIKIFKTAVEDIRLTKADIEELKNHPKVRFYDFTARKTGGSDNN